MRLEAKRKLALVFDKLDSNGDKNIDIYELKDYCRRLQLPVEDADVKAFFESDASGDEMLNFDEFCEFFKARLRHVFDAIDTDKNENLNATELRQVLINMDIDLPLRKVKSMLSEMDTDQSGEVDFDEFCEFFSDVPTPNMMAVTSKLAGGLSIDIGSDIAPAPLPPPEIPIWQFLFAGGLGGVASRTLTAPIETIKIIAQTQKAKSNTGLLFIGNAIKDARGLRGLFAGNLTNVIRIFPTNAMVSIVYSRMIKYTPVDNESNPHQPEWRLLSGATAGVAATLFTHPLDVVRARLTVQSTEATNAMHYYGIRNALKRITAEEGIRGLYKGLSPTLLSIAPFMAVQQCVYDLLRIESANYNIPQSAYTFLACGAIAGTLAQTTIHPLDVVRRQMQIDKRIGNENGVKQTSYNSLKTLWRNGGLPRLYAGLTAAYVKVIPAAMISLLVRDAILGRIED